MERLTFGQAVEGRVAKLVDMKHALEAPKRPPKLVYVCTEVSILNTNLEV